MKIFVTGASGFVGGAFTSAAVKSGHAVIAMARSEKSAQAVAARGATPVRCELGKVARKDHSHASSADDSNSHARFLCSGCAGPAEFQEGSMPFSNFGSAGFISSHGCASDVHTSVLGLNQLGSSRLPALITAN